PLGRARSRPAVLQGQPRPRSVPHALHSSDSRTTRPEGPSGSRTSHVDMTRMYENRTASGAKAPRPVAHADREPGQTQDHRMDPTASERPSETITSPAFVARLD